jgi:hypothetical protein
LPPVDAQSPPPRPLYVSIPLGPRVAPTPISADIVLTDQTGAASAGNVNDAIDRFPARAAEAIRWTTFHSDFPPPDGLGFLQDIKADGDNNEENLGFSLLAKMAYKDYFNDDAGGDRFRDQVRTKLDKEIPGLVGTSPNRDVGPVHLHWHGEYDVLLQSYLALYYRYYDVLSPDTRRKLLALMTVNGPFPVKAPFVSWRANYFFKTFHVPIIPPFFFFDAEVPESENHILMIETARYLTNQLLYQQEVADAAAAGRAPDHEKFDNNRNGGGQDGQLPLVVFILGMLQDILENDLSNTTLDPTKITRWSRF